MDPALEVQFQLEEVGYLRISGTLRPATQQKLREMHSAFGNTFTYALCDIDDDPRFEGLFVRFLCDFPKGSDTPPDVSRAVVADPRGALVAGVSYGLQPRVSTPAAVAAAAATAPDRSGAGAGSAEFLAGVLDALEPSIALEAMQEIMDKEERERAAWGRGHDMLDWEDEGTQVHTAGVGDNADVAAAAAAATSSAGATAAAAPATPTPQLTGTAQSPSAPAQQPSSPYTRYYDPPLDTLLYEIDTVLRESLRRMYCSHVPTIIVPAPPRTHRAAAKLQEQVDKLIKTGRGYEAVPWQCQLAMYSLTAPDRGPEHAASLRAVRDLVYTLQQGGDCWGSLLAWVLPRGVQEWGLAHPDTRRLLQWGAQCVYSVDDPTLIEPLFKAVCNILQHMPGGLGWGTARTAPVPDEEAYNDHAVMQLEAEDALSDGDLAEAKELAARCIAYFGQLGPHWLGSPRRVRSLLIKALCASEPEEAGAVLLEAKRAAQRELGPTHPMALDCYEMYAALLSQQGRHEQALSLLQKTVRLAKATLGSRHSKVFEFEAATARVLAATGSPTAAEEMLRDTFQRAVTSLGTKDTAVEDTLRIHWRLLHTTLGKPQAAEDLKRLAEQMGCDVSVCQKDESDTYVGALGAVQLPTLPYTERIYSYQSD